MSELKKIFRYVLLTFFIVTNTYVIKVVNDFTEETKGREERSEKKGRYYFPLFEVVQFPNDECITSDQLTGTCYTVTECLMMRGVPRGMCAAGFGVCCFWNVTCGGIAVKNRTYFINPNFPLPFNNEQRCVITVLKPIAITSIVHELRINFRTFLMSQPTFGRCETDSFTVPSDIRRVPVICGNNSGLHMYIDFTGRRDIEIIISSKGTDTLRLWTLELLFIEHNNPSKAPGGCLLYYTGKTGIIRTFNTNTNSTLQGLTSNVQYSICIRDESEICEIIYEAHMFRLVSDGLQTSLRGDYCQTNYIGIAGGFTVNNRSIIASKHSKSFDRFCGHFFSTEMNATQNNAIKSTQKPFIVRVKTGHFVQPNNGFVMKYSQHIC